MACHLDLWPLLLRVLLGALFSKHPNFTSLYPNFFSLLLLQLYGAYYRRMSKKVQTELAEANSVAEEALSSMTTVKAHAAEDSTLAAYAAKLRRFYVLQQRCVGVRGDEGWLFD